MIFKYEEIVVIMSIDTIYKNEGDQVKLRSKLMKLTLKHKPTLTIVVEEHLGLLTFLLK